MLPHGTGKAVRVGVFATGEDAAAAKAAGARADACPARCYAQMTELGWQQCPRFPASPRDARALRRGNCFFGCMSA